MGESSSGITEYIHVEREQNGGDKVDLLLNQSPAFVYKKPLDERKGRIGTPEVHLLDYASRENLPRGLGTWPVDSSTGSEATYSYGPWINEPQLGGNVVLKMRVLEEQIESERTALLRANRVFTEDKKARPMRLYGYGTGEVEDPWLGTEVYGYVLQELMPENFVQYAEFIKDNPQLSSEQACDLVISFADALRTMHQAGVTHGDLEGQGLEEHVYIDPRTRQMRIIDWSHANITKGTQTHAGTLLLDHAGIRQMMEQLINPHVTDIQARSILETIEGKINSEDAYPEENDESKSYELSAQGTTNLVQDLQTLKTLIVK